MALANDLPDPPFATLYEAVRHWGTHMPHAPVIVEAGREPLCYGNLLASVDAIGHVLNDIGLGRGNRVAIVHPGGRDMAAAIVGIWSYATAVPVNPDSTPSELDRQLCDMHVDAVAITTDMETPARQAAEKLGLPILDLQPDGRGAMAVSAPPSRTAPRADRPEPSQGEDVAVVLATSGTTSRSKVVPQKHRHLILRNYYTGQSLKVGPKDRCLNLGRLYHSGGLGQGLSTPLIAGGSLGVLTDFSIDGFFQALEALEPTWTTGSYAFYHAVHRQMGAYADAIERVAPRLRFLRSGTGPLNPQIAEELEKAFGSAILVTYGTSESGVVTSDSPPPHPRKWGSAGPVLHDDVAVFDEAGQALPRNAEGEIAVCGPTVFDGYEGDEAANRLAFVDGWYRTGDLGYLDADGFLFLTGRIKEMINRGGQKISPGEIDDALLAHPRVHAASAFPVPHPTLGEVVAAAVVLEDGPPIEERALLEFLREQLAEYKVPRRLLFVDEIPKGPTGKVQRHKLAAAFGLARSG
ncbi:MAG: AMP-binding protein [Alphaproteobacteria bacterium]|nr:AMP-binding protein [Alphaproteobacteria bacterium]